MMRTSGKGGAPAPCQVSRRNPASYGRASVAKALAKVGAKFALKRLGWVRLGWSEGRFSHRRLTDHRRDASRPRAGRRGTVGRGGSVSEQIGRGRVGNRKRARMCAELALSSISQIGKPWLATPQTPQIRKLFLQLRVFVTQVGARKFSCCKPSPHRAVGRWATAAALGVLRAHLTGATLEAEVHWPSTGPAPEIAHLRKWTRVSPNPQTFSSKRRFFCAHFFANPVTLYANSVYSAPIRRIFYANRRNAIPDRRKKFAKLHISREITPAPQTPLQNAITVGTGE